MICEKCGQKVATAYCTIIENNVSKQKFLCGDCRRIYLKEIETKAPIDIAKDVVCTNCGTTLKDFMASGYVGCQVCYYEFGGMMKKAINSYQKANEHTGKVPERFAKKQKLESLQQLLEQAMLNQDLAQVNRLSREIKKLTGGEK